ncbi:Zinc finger, CCHC domain containing, partial [Perkinsus olseni]
QQRQEAAKKAAAQSTTTDTTAAAAAAAEASPTETNGTSTTTAAIGSEAKDSSPVGAASPAAEVPSSATVNPAELVDSELSSFVERVALTDEDHHVHNHILGSILSVARSNLDIEATIETFGSAASGLSEKSSDIDATIICRFSALKKRFGAAGDEKSLCSAAVM